MLRNRHELTVKLLLKKRANIRASNKDKQTVLYITLKNRYKLTIKLLLKKRTNIQDTNKDK